jgi:WD40 repeat protein
LRRDVESLLAHANTNDSFLATPEAQSPAQLAALRQHPWLTAAGTILGTASKLKLWQINPPRLRREIGEHSAPMLAVAFSLDGKQIVCGGQDRSVRVYTRRRSLWGWPLD